VLRAFILLILIASASVLTSAQQNDTAKVVGTVLDATHNSVPNAIITLTHLATNAQTAVKSNKNGQYQTPPLRLGEYTMLVEAPGYERFERKGVVLNIGDIRQLDASLKVGDVTETMVVEAAAPTLQTEDSSVGTVITNKQITDLPLNGRNYLQLAALSAGTAPPAANGVGISVGGQAGSQVSFLLDGEDNNNQQISVSHSNRKEIIKPSIDAIEEFKVSTNSYDAEYGRSSSGVISVAIKSGSNHLHGSAFEFLRNQFTDGNNRFATTAAPYKQNQYGGTIGGPLHHDKVFFFGDVELTNIRQTNTVSSTVPTAAQREGVFATSIKNPLTGKPFVNNTILSTSWDPAAVRILSHIPAAQTSGATNYVYNDPANQNPNRWDVRLDGILSGSQNIYGRYSSESDNLSVASPFPSGADGYYSGTGATTTTARSFVIVHSKTWSTNLISTIHAGWNYLNWVNTFPNQSLTGVGIPGVSDANPGFSNIMITGYKSNVGGHQETSFIGHLPV